jgi:hypothetical protein
MAVTTMPPTRSPQRDLHFMGDPSLWSTWPFLPLVRRHTGGRIDYGVLFDAQAVCNLTGYRCTVYLQLCGPPHKLNYADFAVMQS